MKRETRCPPDPKRYPFPVSTRRPGALLAASVCWLAVAACSKKVPEPEPERVEQAKEAKAHRTLDPAASIAIPGHSRTEVSESHWERPDTKVAASGSDQRLSTPPRRPAGSTRAPNVARVPVSPDDPLQGKFSLDDALKGLEGEGKLVASLDTQGGKLTCELYEDRAPITVANFVGLARGLRPYKNPAGKWVKEAAYDGTLFHRIIKGFMIQGGDPEGSGKGEPGYVIPDEIWDGAQHDRRGLLCMANRGRNTNGMQFFIMDGKAKHLDGGYTIFGECGPDAVVEKLASWEVVGDRAVNPPKIQKLTIERKK